MFNPDFEKELEEAIKRASNFANDNFVTVIGNVDNRLIEEAKKHGLNLSGYRHNIDVYGIKHSFKRHGNKDSEKLHG